MNCIDQEQAGLAALRLERTDRVPRTEFSANSHWGLVSAVTGMDASRPEARPAASAEFVRRWEYAWYFSTPVNREMLARNGRITSMGHAEYAEIMDGRSDRDDRIEKPFADMEDALSLDPLEEYGIFNRTALVKELEDAFARRRAEYPGPLHMGGVYVTLFSGLIEIFGWDAFLAAAATDEVRFGRVIDGYFRWILQFFEAYAESSIPVIMSHDDLCWTSGPVFHPEWYRKWIFPYIKRLWAPLREAGKLIMFTCDGNWTEFFDDIVECGANHVVMEPCSDMARFAGRYGAKVGFTGNADTRILLMGSREEIEAEVRRCMEIGKRYPGYVMAVGNHIPQNTPVENALWYDECYRRFSGR